MGPQANPEKQRHCERQRVEAHAPADQRGISGFAAPGGGTSSSMPMRPDGRFFKSDNDGREPGENHAEVWNQIDQA
jgi:hypothetical protein